MKKYVFAIIGCFALCAFSFALSQKAVLKMEMLDGKTNTKSVSLERQADGAMRLRIPIAEIDRNTRDICVYTDDFTAQKGDNGYYIIPSVSKGMLGKFKYDNGRNVFPQPEMKFYGIKKNSGTYIAIVKGLSLEYSMIVSVKDGEYKIAPRFEISRIDFDPYEDLVVDFYELDAQNGNYVGICKKYRDYQVSRGEIVPLSERVKNNPQLKNTVESIFVRIKMANNKRPKSNFSANDPKWDTMKHELNIMHTFDSVKDIMTKMYDLGVKKADVCFVGWQTGGFDGYFPDLFPVEERLGGEAKMKEAISYGKSLGYNMTTHINNHNYYKRAKRWSEKDVSWNKKGEPRVYTVWPGGKAYYSCYQVICDRIIDSDIEHLKAMGLNAPQHVDVSTANKPTPCCNPLHPANREIQRQYHIKIAEKYRKAFGGFTSEAGIDHDASVLDYALYTSNLLAELKAKNKVVVDCMLEKEVYPIWQIVYHGYILSNPEWLTIDAYLLPEGHDYRLKLIECGGRPTFYWTNYKGDLNGIKEAYLDYEKLSYLQYYTIEDHRQIENKVFVTTYSDGSETVVNYSDRDIEYKDEVIRRHSWKLFKGNMKTVKDGVNDAAESVKNAAQEAAETTKDGVKKAYKSILDWWNN